MIFTYGILDYALKSGIGFREAITSGASEAIESVCRQKNIPKMEGCFERVLVVFE
jgi:hypothetical protein